MEVVNCQQCLAAELVLELENTKPSKDTFHFGSLSGRLERAGTYMLQYVMSPARPAMDALTVSARLEVAAGPAVEMAVQASSLDLARLPPVRLF